MPAVFNSNAKCRVLDYIRLNGGHLVGLPDRHHSLHRKFKTAAAKPEVVIALVLLQIGSPLQRQTYVYEDSEFKAITYNSDRYRPTTETRWRLPKPEVFITVGRYRSLLYVVTSNIWFAYGIEIQSVTIPVL